MSAAADDLSTWIDLVGHLADSEAAAQPPSTVSVLRQLQLRMLQAWLLEQHYQQLTNEAGQGPRADIADSEVQR